MKTTTAADRKAEQLIKISQAEFTALMEERHLASRRARYALRAQAKAAAKVEGLHGAAASSRAKALYRRAIIATRTSRLALTA